MTTTVRGWALLLASVALVSPALVPAAPVSAALVSATAVSAAGSHTEALPAMRLAKVQYDPPGDDDLSNTSLNKEWVQVRNYGVKPWDLTGWSIRDVTGYKFKFPEGFMVEPGVTVTIHTGSGKNRALHLYWGQGSYVWNNTGDKVIFKNAAGKVVDTCAYDGTGSSVTC